MMLEPGSTLGPYEIVRLIGAGGMGEVYEALDARIGRQVAVKILPRELALDAGRLRRFQQEARAAGALSHPNVLALYDLGEEDGIHYLVTELLEGESLRERLRRGTLGTRQSLEVALQIAEGLAAAHERGMVHRDLKPDNVFLTREGRAKILDFGLAKLAAPEAGEPAISRSGTILGTAAYMAPEQVTGDEVDARADIFSLGAILYELLTGERAFQRGTAAATLHAVLHAEPPHLDRPHQALPRPVAIVVAGCLEKEPARRFQSARDLTVTLRSLAGVGSLPPTEVAIPHSLRRRRPWRPSRHTLVALACAACLVAGLAIGWRGRGSEPRGQPVPALRHLTRSQNDSAPALAPDGRSVVFVSRRDGRPRIWVKELVGGAESPLTPGPDLFPRFSPDGSELLFVRLAEGEGVLTKMPFPGGQPRTLLRDVFGADWSPDGRTIAYVRHENPAPGPLTIVGLLTPATGASRVLARIGGSTLYQPRFAPDGAHVAMVAAGEEIVLVSVAGGAVRRVAPPPPRRSLSTAAWDGPHHLVVLEAGGPQPGVALAAGLCQRLDVRDGTTEELFSTANWGQHLDAGKGRIVFSAGLSRQRLWEAPLDADGVAGPGRWLTLGSSLDRQPAYSPDGKWIVFSSDRSGNLDLWKIERATGELVRLSDDPGVDWDPSFTATGDLVWATDRGGRFQIWSAAADGGGARPLVAVDLSTSDPVPISPDWLVFVGSGNAGSGLWRVGLDGRGLERLRGGTFMLPAPSADGSRLAVLEASAQDPRLTSLRVLAWPSAETESTVPLATQSLTDLVLQGRAAFWGAHRLAYIADDASGHAGILVRDLAAPGEAPRPLAGFAPSFLPETFAFSPGGTHLAVSRLELQQNLMLAELRPRSAGLVVP